ncbi:MAG TPA: SH3 domain-containing protein [Gemmatimonadaceae bacterium]|nr:SH3 domain-containing protein [Gemmatimonadaceae bacterium]
MRPPVLLLFGALALGVCTPDPARSQAAVASTGLNVRSGQSTQSDVRGTIEAGDTVDLVSAAKRKGYYHVTTRGSTPITGWAWAARLHVVEGAASGNPGVSLSGNTVASNGAVDSSWTRTASNAVDIHWPDGDHALCAADGLGGDSLTNHLKNRTDEPTSYHEVSWDSLAQLSFPHNARKYREGSHAWPQSDLDAIATYEGLPISVVGFLSGIKVEGKESTNCAQTDSSRVDWHMYLTKGKGQKTRQAIVVETTPRVRPNHPGWTVDAIKGFVQAGDTVRISGWLMLDPEHFDQMWQYRSPSDTTGTKARITLWEIHPITRIEVRRNGAWQSLDQ